MHDLLHRLATSLLFAAGVATLAEAAAMGGVPATLSLQHHQALLALTGAALLASPWWPPLRIPAAAVALLSKASLLLLALLAAPEASGPLPLATDVLQAVMLLAAGAILVREARQEARWNMGWRQKG